MREDLKTLLDQLGVDHILHAYETQPWMHYDDEEGITCSAEVRMGPGACNMEAEIQFLYDDPEKHEKTNPEQILLMRIMPVKNDEWQPEQLWVKGENYVNEIGNWEKKGCAFFKSCVQAIVAGKLPDIEKLIKTKLDGGKSKSGSSGRIGRKSPRIRPENLLGMGKKP